MQERGNFLKRLSNIKNELSPFQIQKNEVYEKLYLLSLEDYDFLFRDLENKYNDSVNKNLSNLFIGNIFNPLFHIL